MLQQTWSQKYNGPKEDVMWISHFNKQHNVWWRSGYIFTSFTWCLFLRCLVREKSERKIIVLVGCMLSHSIAYWINPTQAHLPKEQEIHVVMCNGVSPSSRSPSQAHKQHVSAQGTYSYHMNLHWKIHESTSYGNAGSLQDAGQH